MTTLVLIGALVLALILACAAAFVAWRERASADDRVAEAVASLASAMHETMQDLAEALEAAEHPGARPASPERPGHELAASLDPEEVAARTLERAASVAGVDAVVLDTAAAGGGRLLVTHGLGEEDAAKVALPLPANENVRALEVSFRYRIDDVGSTAPVVRSGVLLPLRADGAPVGSLGAFTRTSSRTLTDAQIDELERLAAHAGRALANARRYVEALSLADVDPLTGLQSRRAFEAMLEREVARAHRHRRLLSLILVDVDDFRAVAERLGAAAADAALAEIAACVQSVVRRADVPGRVAGDRFAVVAPETGPEEAELLAARIVRAVAARPAGAAGALRVSAGVAALRPGEPLSQLLARAGDALDRAKELGKARAVAADGA